MPPTLVLFTKYPTPGQVKTRLERTVGAARAAEIHRRLTERTLGILRRLEAPLEIQYAGAERHDFEDWLGADNHYEPQADGDLSDRLLSALREEPVILFGADTPDLSAEIVAEAITALDRHDAVIGPAEDGGYYLIGLAYPMPFLFENMAWSTSRVLPETLARLDGQGASYRLLDELADCDRPEDLRRWPWLMA